MTSNTNIARSNGGQSTDIKSSETIVSGGFSAEKEDPEETIPGWTIMRPLKRNSGKKIEAGTKLIPNVSRSLSQSSNEAENDLKTIGTNRTNGSGDGYGGIGDVETLHEVRSDDELLEAEDEREPRHRGQRARHTPQSNGSHVDGTEGGDIQYKVYKRRWFGLFQLVLLNVIISWDVSVTITLRLHICIYLPANVICSGSRSLPIRLLSPNTTTCLTRLSIGSVPPSCSRSLSSHLSQSIFSIEGDRSPL